MHHTLARLAACLLFWNLAGCGNVQKPTLEFKSMSIGEVSASGFTMNVDVDVKNPNAVALPLTQADYGLKLGGVKVIDGAKIKPAASIPANGRGTITIPVLLTFENLLLAEEAIRKGGGDVKYGIDAGLSFDTGVPVLGMIRAPFSHEGTLAVKDLLKNNWKVILNSPAAKKLAKELLGGLLNF